MAGVERDTNRAGDHPVSGSMDAVGLCGQCGLEELDGDLGLVSEGVVDGATLRRPHHGMPILLRHSLGDHPIPVRGLMSGGKVSAR